MTRILVTGATGFIGARVLAPLRERGFEVHAVGRQPPEDADVRFHPADLFDPEQVGTALRAAAATHLLHLAWYAEPGAYWRSPLNLDWVAASLRLLQGFVAAGGRRAVLAGSCAEYRWGAPRFDEQASPTEPATLYGAAKDALRRLTMAYAETAGFSAVWGRVFFLYGPGERAGRLVSGAVTSLLDGRAFPTSHGQQRRDYLHVDDVAGGFAALACSDVVGPVNIASGTAVPVRRLLDAIAQETGRADLLGYGDLRLAPSEPPVIEGCNRRLVEEVGYKLGHDLEAGLKSTVDWWRARETIGDQVCRV